MKRKIDIASVGASTSNMIRKGLDMLTLSKSDAPAFNILPMELTEESFYDFIIEQFELSELTQTAFAKKIGVSRSSLNNMFKKKQLPQGDKMLNIFCSLNYTLFLHKK